MKSCRRHYLPFPLHVHLLQAILYDMSHLKTRTCLDEDGRRIVGMENSVSKNPCCLRESTHQCYNSRSCLHALAVNCQTILVWRGIADTDHGYVVFFTIPDPCAFLKYASENRSVFLKIRREVSFFPSSFWRRVNMKGEWIWILRRVAAGIGSNVTCALKNNEVLAHFSRKSTIKTTSSRFSQKNRLVHLRILYKTSVQAYKLLNFHFPTKLHQKKILKFFIASKHADT